jgi:uncharacterized membrane protein
MSETERDWNAFDPEARTDGRSVARWSRRAWGWGRSWLTSTGGEMSVLTTWRTRFDETINWAVTIISAILIYAFSTDGNHVTLLTGVAVVAMFAGIEARRYQAYDVYRARMLRENLFANALDPSRGVGHRDWRRELSEGYRNPTVKTPYFEALWRRLRRIYLPFFVLMLAAWLFKLAAFSNRPTLEVAAVRNVPGLTIFGVVGLLYFVMVAIAFWPRERQAKGGSPTSNTTNGRKATEPTRRARPSRPSSARFLNPFTRV